MRRSGSFFAALLMMLVLLGVPAAPTQAATSTRSQIYGLLSFEDGVLRVKRDFFISNPGLNYGIDISVDGTSTLEGAMTVQSVPEDLCVVQNSSQVRCTGTATMVVISFIELYRPNIAADGTFTLRMDGGGSAVRNFLFQLNNNIGLTIVSASEPPRSDNGTILEWFKADTTAYRVTVTVRAPGATIPTPTASLNFSTGQPGSFFTIRGANFPPSATLTLLVNGTVVSSATAAADGTLTLTLATASSATPGRYRLLLTVASNAQLAATSSASEVLTLDPGAPLRARELPDTPLIEVPGSVAPTNVVFTPMIVR